MTTVSDHASIADVYSGDVSSTDVADRSNGAVHIFKIEAEAQPGAFGRIANIFNIANLAPNRANLEFDNNTESLRIEIEISVQPNIADSLRRKLTQLTEVIQVGVVAPVSSVAETNSGVEFD